MVHALKDLFVAKAEMVAFVSNLLRLKNTVETPPTVNLVDYTAKKKAIVAGKLELVLKDWYAAENCV